MLYPIGVQSFPEIVTDDFFYVDKTGLIFDLVKNFRACFLSRPRRFGKSLLLSTLESYLRGEKDLFRGLEISKLEKDWIKREVIHIDLNNGQYDSIDSLKQFLNEELDKLDEIYQVNTAGKTIGTRFEIAITKAYESSGQKVAVLIDEYDKPMLEILSDELLQEEYRKVLKPFYGTLKKCQRYLRFIFITGVTKFAKLSIFSDLNQLKDISLLPEFGTICGITTQEMLTNFTPEIEKFAKEHDWSFSDMVNELERKYDGYHFSRKLEGVLNPFSLLNALHDKDLGNYWFQTATPNFLVDVLKEHHTDLRTLAKSSASPDLLTSVESVKINPLPVIYQSGYLTIKNYNKEKRSFTLDYPNDEVKESFLSFLLPRYANLNLATSDDEINKLVEDLNNGDTEKFLLRVQALFAKVNHKLILNREVHYQNVLYIVFTLLGLHVHVEQHTSEGSIDMVIATNRYVYIMEFKYKSTATAAIKQIYDKGYAIPYQCDSRKVILVAVNFSARTRTLDPNWIIKEYE